MDDGTRSALNIGERNSMLKLVKEHRCLSDRQKKVLILRFGLEDGQERTLQEIGDSFNKSRERIRQIESMALSILRRRHSRDDLLEIIEPKL